MPAIYDESIQIACAVLPLASLLWMYGGRLKELLIRLYKRASSEAGVRTAADVEGGELKRGASKGSLAQREIDKQEEEAIKKRASTKVNGSG